jgi:hypothetical protein
MTHTHSFYFRVKRRSILIYLLIVLFSGIALAILHTYQASATRLEMVNSSPVHVYSWHAFFGGVDSQDEGYSVATDPDGNIYIVGMSNKRWLGPGDSPPLQEPGGSSDVVVLKLDKHGDYQWHTFYGSPDGDRANGVAVDHNGDIYVTGFSMQSWKGPQENDPIHAFDGFWNLFVLKLNTNGAYQWHTFYGGETDMGFGITLDGKGGVYVAGQSYSSWLGDGDSEPLHPFSESIYDMVILKLDTSGVYQWHTFYGSSDHDSAWEVVTDGIGGVYVVCSTGTWNGDGNTPPLHAHSGGHDIAMLKLTADGEYVWHTFYGNSQGDDGLGLDIDNNRNIFMTGASSGTWLGDHGIQPLHSFSGGEWDIVILKLSEQGEYQWHTFYGSSDGMYWEEAGHGITVTGDGLVSVVGHATNTWLGDWNVPPITPFNGPIDTFLLVLDSQGTYQQHRFYGAGAPGGYQLFCTRQRYLYRWRRQYHLNRKFCRDLAG